MAATVIVAARVPAETKILAGLAAQRQEISLSAWVADRVRRAALDDLARAGTLDTDPPTVQGAVQGVSRPVSVHPERSS
jgi:hypothetical protein